MTGFPNVEENILALWKALGAPKIRQDLSQGQKPYVLYDGPPADLEFPHHGYLLSSTIKDVVSRYWSMTGRDIKCLAAWSTPNATGCNEETLAHAFVWRENIKRLGCWMEFDDAPKASRGAWMDSVWGVFKTLCDKGQIYRHFKVIPYSTVLRSPVNDFEARRNVKIVRDPAIVVTFPDIHGSVACLLAWTTTLWTLPMHIAIAVNADWEYIWIHDEASGKEYILLESLLKNIYNDPETARFSIVKRIQGKDMVGWQYEPPFDYFYTGSNADRWFRVIHASWVSAEEGVGMVHLAPSCRQEDLLALTEAGMISADNLPPNPVDERGHYTGEVRDFANQHVREAEQAILVALKQRNRIVVQSQIAHSVPFCWQSNERLIEQLVPAWFINVHDVIPQLLETINDSRWVPESAKDKHVVGVISNMRDWNFSTASRAGTPIPLWASKDFDEVVCIGSLAELKKRCDYSGDLSDLDRATIDSITIPNRNGKGVLHRIPEVFDSSFEYGSLPHASRHCSSENRDVSANYTRANLVVEGQDQTLSFVFPLLVLGQHLWHSSPFKTCIVTGSVLGDQETQQAENFQGCSNPILAMSSHGADALRLSMIMSSGMRAEAVLFQTSDIEDVVKTILNPFWDIYKIFETLVTTRKVESVELVFDPWEEGRSKDIFDRWILSMCHIALRRLIGEMKANRLDSAIRGLLGLLGDMTQKYLRVNVERFKEDPGSEEALHGLKTLCEGLFLLTRALAPFIPFLAERVYQLLRPCLPKSVLPADARSVHFLAYPMVQEQLIDQKLEDLFTRIQFRFL